MTDDTVSDTELPDAEAKAPKPTALITPLHDDRVDTCPGPKKHSGTAVLALAQLNAGWVSDDGKELQVLAARRVAWRGAVGEIPDRTGITLYPYEDTHDDTDTGYRHMTVEILAHTPIGDPTCHYCRQAATP